MAREHKLLLLRFAEIYGEALAESRLNYYAELFDKVPIPEFESALKSIMLDPKVQRFPLPAVLVQHLRTTVSDDQLAVEAAARVVTAISRYGWNNEAQAREYVGGLGWAVVEKQGGWQKLCADLKAADIGVFQAQARELAKTQLVMARAGRTDEAPKLPNAENKALGLSHIAGMLPKKSL